MAQRGLVKILRTNTCLLFIESKKYDFGQKWQKITKEKRFKQKRKHTIIERIAAEMISCISNHWSLIPIHRYYWSMNTEKCLLECCSDVFCLKYKMCDPGVTARRTDAESANVAEGVREDYWWGKLVFIHGVLLLAGRQTTQGKGAALQQCYRCNTEVKSHSWKLSCVRIKERRDWLTAGVPMYEE